MAGAHTGDRPQRQATPHASRQQCCCGLPQLRRTRERQSSDSNRRSAKQMNLDQQPYTYLILPALSHRPSKWADCNNYGDVHSAPFSFYGDVHSTRFSYPPLCKPAPTVVLLSDWLKQLFIYNRSYSFHTELRSCVKVEVDVLGSRP